METELLYLCMGNLRGESVMRAPLLGTLKDTKRKAQEPGISLHRCPVGEAEWGDPCRWTLRDSTRALCKRNVSLYGSSLREYGSRAPLLGTLKIT